MFKKTATAIVMAAVALAAVFSSHWLPIATLVCAAYFLGFNELDRLVSFGPLRAVALVWGTAVGLLLSASLQGAILFGTAWATLGLGVFGLLPSLNRRFPFWLKLLSSTWISAPAGLSVSIHQSTPIGNGLIVANCLLVLLVPVWLGDTAAMLVGRSFGKRPLAPAISPNKTWEGAIANLVACVAGAMAVGAVTKVPIAPSLAIGFVTGTVGQAGDLLQSAVKRSAGLKDSGGLLPGHGGVLDRIDSAMLAFVPAATVLWTMAPHLFARPE